MSRAIGQPNILLILTDQLSALATAPYGNRDVLTPHLSALAARGAVFEHAYCNAPLCVPSRASLMTGQLPSRLPVNDNGEGLDAATPTVAHHLRRGGYRTILSGKMHFVGPDQLHGFEERLTTDVYPADFGWTPSWARLRELVRRADSADSADDSHSPHPAAAACVKGAGPVPWTMHFTHDEEVHFRALERLRALAVGGDDRPWFLCVSYTHPHDPYTTTPTHWDRYEGAEIAPPADPPPGYIPHPMDRWVNIHHGVERVAPTQEEVYRSRRGYYANISYLDDKLGELVGELARLGLDDDTIVIYTSDHGDMCGEHGMWFKRTVREWSARVPLIMAGPGIPPGRQIAENASLVDLFPTLIALAGLRLPAGYARFAPRLDGRDLTPLLRDESPDEWEDEVSVEYNGDGTCQPIRALVLGRHKFIAVHGEPDQLYDLARDPGEWHNLADTPAHRDLAADLRARLLADWEPAATEARVLASQRRRLFLNEALYQGAYTPWDYQPHFDATRMYARRDPTRPWAAQVYQRWLIDSQSQSEVLDEVDDLWDSSTP